MREPPFAANLLAMAKAARQHAYAPYSGFAVGAALIDESGRVHTGSNVENASYGLTTCAERVALTSAVGSGARRFLAIAVAGPGEAEPLFPCGGCRQILREFSSDLPVIVSDGAGGLRVFSLDELLPRPFGPGSLPRAKETDD